jgi:hypothetical protein
MLYGTTKMSLFNTLNAVFLRLSTVPGLGFLYEWVHELEQRRMRRQAIIGTYKGYVSSIKDAGKEAGKAVPGRGGQGNQAGDVDSVGHDRPGGPSEDSRRGRDNDFDDDLDQDYEDDDFESYLQ